MSATARLAEPIAVQSPACRGCPTLLIEDNPDHRLLERKALQTLESCNAVITAENAMEGMKLLQEQEFQLVVADYQMPGMNGLEFLRKLKAGGIRIPVVMVTGLGNERVAVQAIKEGAYDYIIKESGYLDLLPTVAERAVSAFTTQRLLGEAQRELSKSEERFRDLVHSLGAVVWEADPLTFQFRFVNQRAEEIFGYPLEQWLSDPYFWMSLVHPDDKSMLLENLRIAIEEGDDRSFEHRALSADGRTIWVCSHISTASENGKVTLLRGLMLDFTERKHIEEAYHASRERYRDLVENAKDIIFSLDRGGNFVSVNKAVERITNYTREEILKLNISQILAPECKDLVGQMMGRKVSDGSPTTFEVEAMAGKDGQRVALEVNSWPIFHEEKIVGVQGIARDVTERKRLEAQLLQAQKMESIGTLAGGVAHDFNNLLTSIIGFADLALMQSDRSDRRRAQLEEILKAGNRAASLTRQLLAFSRKQLLQPKVLNLNAVVADLEKMLQRLIGEDIDFVTVLDPALKQVEADEGQIEQVIMNLVVNARDAMPQGGKLIIETTNIRLHEKHVQTHLGLQPGVYAMLAVSDSGCGMDAQTQARIFEPFFTTKEVGKGTGLGLSTVYGIVRQSGGRISVYSEPGGGSTFKIYFPAIEEQLEPEEMCEAADAIPHGSETILLVEDEESLRQLARNVLESCGYTVLEAADGQKALKLCGQHAAPINLVLTDIVMPNMSGCELAKYLVQIRPETKVLYMSGHTADALLHRGVIEEGMLLLEKPFYPEALVRKVQQVLRTTPHQH